MLSLRHQCVSNYTNIGCIKNRMHLGEMRLISTNGLILDSKKGNGNNNNNDLPLNKYYILHRFQQLEQLNWSILILCGKLHCSRSFKDQFARAAEDTLNQPRNLMGSICDLSESVFGECIYLQYCMALWRLMIILGATVALHKAYVVWIPCRLMYSSCCYLPPGLQVAFFF